ncbi:MAG: O-antigen ligase family protein [Sulfurimonadaceae bacterium]
MSLLTWIRNDTNNLLVLNYTLISYILSLTLTYRLDRVIIGIMIILFLFNENLKEHLFSALKNKVVQAFLFFFAVVVLWSFGSEDFELALYHIKSYRYFLYPVLFVAIIRKEFINKFIYAFLIGMLINVVWSYLIFLDIASSPFMRVANTNLPLLVKSDHGFFVLVGLGYSLFRLLTFKDTKILKLLFFIFFILESFNIFLTESKTSMLMYALMIFIVLAYVYRTKFLKISLLATSLIVFVYFLAFNLTNSFEKQMQGIKHEITLALEDHYFNTSVGTRIGFALLGTEILKEHFLFGVGTADHIASMRSKMEEYPQLIKNKSFNEMYRCLNEGGRWASLHNFYLNIFIQFGIIGLIVFFHIAYRIYTHKYKNQDYQFMAFLVCTLGIVFAASGWDFQFANFGRFFVVMICLFIAFEYSSATHH